MQTGQDFRALKNRERWKDFGRFLIHPTMLAVYVFAYLLGMLSTRFF